MTIPNSKSKFENLRMLPERKSLPFNQQRQPKHPYTLTNQSIQHTMLQKSSTTHNISTYPKSYRIQTSASTTEIKPIDFRPLITHGRRKFSAISSSSMIITKKKSPSPMNHISSNQVYLFI
jgi:hypothetical protein